MLTKKVIREEDPDTGKIKKETVRYDGVWKETVQGDTVLLIMLDDKEIVNTVIKVPSSKELHIRLRMSSIQVDKKA